MPYAWPYDHSRASLFHPGEARDFFSHGMPPSEAALATELRDGSDCRCRTVVDQAPASGSGLAFVDGQPDEAGPGLHHRPPPRGRRRVRRGPCPLRPLLRSHHQGPAFLQTRAGGSTATATATATAGWTWARRRSPPPGGRPPSTTF